jgi:hypothetical protein
MKYQPLPTTWRKDGYDFTLLDRSDELVLLQKTKPDHINKEHYEVVRVFKQTPTPGQRWPGGALVVAKETLAGTDKWGTYGWSFCALAQAKECFMELCWESPAPSPALRSKPATARTGRNRPSK